MAFPFILFTSVALLFFIYAMKWGMVRLIAGALGLAVGMAAFFFSINFVPGFVQEQFKIPVAWQGNLAAAGIVAVICYLISWAIFGFILKFLFNPDSFLHPLVDGIPGGVLSLAASVIFTFFIFSAVRIVGTLHELNYLASVTQPEISDADLDRLPPPSRFIEWRNGIEKVPGLADWMDKCDPFSRRENRNMGAASLFAVREPGRTFASQSSDLGPIIENNEFDALIQSSDMASIMRINDRVGLVLGDESMSIASGQILRPRLRALDVGDQISQFFEFIKTHKAPQYPNPAETLAE